MITEDAMISLRRLGMDENRVNYIREVGCIFTGSREKVAGMPGQLSDMCESFWHVHPRVVNGS